MFALYVSLIVFFSVLLILLTLLQNSKRDNSSGNIIGSMGADQLIGITETTNILSKMTLFCIFAIFIFSVLSYRSIRKNESTQDSPNIELAKKYKSTHEESK